MIGIDDEIKATVRQLNMEPNKKTSRNPNDADIPDEQIITSRTDASLFNPEIKTSFFSALVKICQIN